MSRRGGDGAGGTNPSSPSANRVAEDGERVSETQLAETVAAPNEPEPAPAAESYDLRAGETILGRYRLEKLLARGGIGVVYLATQLGLDRRVALKLLTPRFRHSDPKFARRFYLEAATCARLIHPNIVTVHDYGESENGDLFIAMEYLDGRSLEDLIQPSDPVPFERILRIAIQICRALREAHSHGVIHRDLKHSNIMIVRGPDEDNPDHVKVLDFGIVKLFEPEESSEPRPKNSTLTQDGSFLGSPLYMSPEQICCEVVDTRTDVYSFGVILYELIAGAPPFSGQRLSEVVQQTLTAPVPPIASMGYRRSCPEQLESVVRKCLEKTRDARFASMNELLGELKSAYQVVMGGRALAVSNITSASGGASDGMPASGEFERPERGGARVASTAGRDTDPGSTGPLLDLDRRDPAGPAGQWVELGRPQRPQATEPALLTAPLVSTQDTIVPPPRSATVPWAITLFLGALVAVMLAREYFTREAPPKVIVERPHDSVLSPPPLKEDEVRVVFESTPPGARVEEEGVVIGVTPFIRAYPKTGPEHLRHFVFRLKAHQSRTVETRLDRERVTVRAELVAGQDPEDVRRSVARKALGPPADSVPAGAPRPAEIAAPAPPAGVTEKGEVPQPKSGEAISTGVPSGSGPGTGGAPAADSSSQGEPQRARALEAASRPESAIGGADGKQEPKHAPKPKNVLPQELAQSLLSKVDPALPPSVRAAHRGQTVRIVIRMCTDTSGHVDPDRTKIISAVPGAEAAVLEAVMQWRYRPQPLPLCAPVHIQIKVE